MNWNMVYWLLACLGCLTLGSVIGLYYGLKMGTNWSLLSTCAYRGYEDE